MLSQFFISRILQITNATKPLLVRLLPIALLRWVKRLMVYSTMKHVDRSGILPFSRSLYPDGINLIGPIRSEIGLGQSCRLIAHGLSCSNFAFTIYHYEHAASAQSGESEWDYAITNTTPFNINIIHINPYDLALAYCQLDTQIWNGRYNIAFWLWELERFPTEWVPSLALVDEIWTPSQFASDSIMRVTDKPVHTIPYPIEAQIDANLDRESFSLPADDFLVLSMYDCNSTIERKNPVGAIRAFKRAFSPEQVNVGLIVKVNNPQKRDLALIQRELKGYENIYIITRTMSKTEVNSLISCADVLISLHRAEGFGLVPAEAMLLGTPVVATNWSSNTEFMTSDTACLVDFQMVVLRKSCGPYKKGNRWAEPDIEQAAGYLVDLYHRPEYRVRLADKAYEHIKAVLSRRNAADRINSRIQEIYRGSTKSRG